MTAGTFCQAGVVRDYEQLAAIVPRLRDHGARRSGAQPVAAELAKLVHQTRNAGLPIAEIAREANLSRQGVYDVLRRQ